MTRTMLLTMALLLMACDPPQEEQNKFRANHNLMGITREIAVKADYLCSVKGAADPWCKEARKQWDMLEQMQYELAKTCREYPRWCATERGAWLASDN